MRYTAGISLSRVSSQNKHNSVVETLISRLPESFQIDQLVYDRYSRAPWRRAILMIACRHDANSEPEMTGCGRLYSLRVTDETVSNVSCSANIASD